MKKRKNVALFVFILLLGLGGIAAILAYGAHISANTDHPFVWERRHNAQQLYRQTVELNIRENYPQSPTALMELYTTSVFFLYGDFILCEDIFMEVIEFQREMFSLELLAGTTAAQQFNNLMASLEGFQDEANLLLRRSSIENIRHDFHDQRTALVYVIHPFMFHANLYRVYHLIMDDNDMWRINSWSLADSDFNIIQ